ncbi:AAA domain-containing protein [Astrocystis sublimbata]|nr:AAA domain-containing protein [Astrocystis sublimbata]
MSTIDKLSVSGVRSFSPLDAQTLSFSTPLTLIVGQNGSGKTTIIECLKYATTGELPPNSKGGAFIHDPKLISEPTVLAHVKLRYYTPPHSTYIASRRLQLTVKKTTRSQKTLDGTLQSTNDGESMSVSSKEANLNKLVSDTLGVSPAVLDSVIFCHQEESLWPISEPAALKKRFDEIFEALKYTKAIENLKMLRKKQGETLAKLKAREPGEKRDKDLAEKKQARMVQLLDEIADSRAQLEKMEAEINSLAERSRERREQANSYLLIVNDLKTKTDELRIRKETLDDSKNRMDEELTESDDWLRDTLTQYEARVARYAQDLDEVKLQYQQHKDGLDASRKQLSEKLAEQGRHQSDKANYERHLESRVQLVQQAARVHSIRGYEGALDDRKVHTFYERIQRLLADKRQELEHLQTEYATKVDEQASTISDLDGHKSRYIQNRVYARQRITTCERSIVTLQRDLNAVEVDEGAKAILDAESKDLDQRSQQASQDLQKADFDGKLEQEETQLQQLETESSRLSRELVESTRLSDGRAELRIHKEKLSVKNRALTTLKGTWDQRLSALVGENWDPSTLDHEFRKRMEVKTRALEQASRERDDVLQQHKTAQANMASVKQTAEKREREIKKCKTAVVDALKSIGSDTELGIDALPGEIEEVEESIQTVKSDLALCGELAKYYAGCQKKANEQNKCDLCDRSFANAAEKSRLMAKLRRVLENTAKEEYARELAEHEQTLSQLRAVHPQRETYMRLVAEKKEAEKEQQDVQNEAASTLRRLEEMDDAVRMKQEEKQEFESMDKTVRDITQTYKDIVDAEAQVDRIETQQNSSGTVRSTEEITELQDQCAEQLKAAKNKISKLAGDRQHMRDTINSLELKRSELRNRLSHAVRQLEKKKDYQDQIQNLKDDIVKQKEAVQEADQDLETVEPEIAKARAIKDDIQRRGREKEKKAAGERDRLDSSVKELKMIDTNIQNYINNGGPSNLKNNEQAIDALEKSIRRSDDDMNALVTRSNKMKEEMASSDGRKKNITENLTYRKAARDVNTLKQAVVELEDRRAHEDYERLEGEANSLESKRHVKSANRGTIIGTMNSKDDELKALLDEWESTYKAAADRYRETHIRVETTKAAIEDLGRYGTALNNAIMQYHAMKMEEVNRIAGELWRDTYQGTDIDTILIKSDSEATGGRSSYNYRVCMVKQDTEMDMRGRCSAGQKVLASIIIRLALAESFGVGCGLIALDEPTTNLDRENIKSLAMSLHRIIEARRAQSNFQLIVITHDEDFLRHMRCSDFCDDFWRVSRDEKQNSRIDRESISTIV